MKIFEVMNKAHWHTFQVLTKRPQQLKQMADQLKWTDNIWIGVTVEANDYVDRVDYLRNIDWVIVGGESGYGCREIKKEWVIDVKNRCEKENIPFFFKQWGGVNKKKNGRLLDGQIYDEMPEIKNENLFQ